MFFTSWKAATAAAALTLAPLGLTLPYQDSPPTLTEPNVIAGSMEITFETRTKLDTTGDLKKGSPALGAKDTYKLDVQVAQTT